MLGCGVDKAKVKTYVLRIYLLYVRISPIKSNFFPGFFERIRILQTLDKIRASCTFQHTAFSPS